MNEDKYEKKTRKEKTLSYLILISIIKESKIEQYI